MICSPGPGEQEPSAKRLFIRRFTASVPVAHKAAAASAWDGNVEDTELEVDEWEEAMAREADDEDWWREPNRIDDG